MYFKVLLRITNPGSNLTSNRPANNFFNILWAKVCLRRLKKTYDKTDAQNTYKNITVLPFAILRLLHGNHSTQRKYFNWLPDIKVQWDKNKTSLKQNNN